LWSRDPNILLTAPHVSLVFELIAHSTKMAELTQPSTEPSTAAAVNATSVLTREEGRVHETVADSESTRVSAASAPDPSPDCSPAAIDMGTPVAPLSFSSAPPAGANAGIADALPNGIDSVVGAASALEVEGSTAASVPNNSVGLAVAFDRAPSPRAMAPAPIAAAKETSAPSPPRAAVDDLSQSDMDASMIGAVAPASSSSVSPNSNRLNFAGHSNEPSAVEKPPIHAVSPFHGSGIQKSNPGDQVLRTDSMNDTVAVDPELDHLKALHAARQSARRKKPAAVGSNVISPKHPSFTAQDASVLPADTGSTVSNFLENRRTEADNGEDEIRQLQATHHVELQSLRRNHIENLRKVSEERDMFAAQLVREQANARSSAAVKKQIADLNAQLRAARIRTADMQEELARLQSENKQLYFRVQANKTMHAEADSYSKVVDDLVSVKIKCAQLEEEKEEYRRVSKDALSSVAILSEANGDLEKSRAEWVVQCADLQRQKDELENQLAGLRQDRESAPAKTNRGVQSTRRHSSAPSSNPSFGVALD
jgi:hypothetical protein